MEPAIPSGDQAKHKTKAKEKFQPGEGKCKYVIPRKQRQCGHPTDKISSNFCRFHMAEVDKQENFVQCPNEPRFFLPREKLEEHLKKCPKIKLQSQIEQKAWYTQGVNFMNPQITSSFKSYMELVPDDQVGAGEEVVIQDKRDLQLKDVDESIRNVIADKINALYAKLKEENPDGKFAALFKVDETRDEVERQQKQEGEEGKYSQFLKHSNQQSNIIVSINTSHILQEIMMKHELILPKQGKDQFIYVEFGAGRGGLSSFVALKLLELQNKSNVFIAIDRDARKFKLDKDYREHMLSYRERMDIADFDLQKFLNAKQVEISQQFKVIAIAKHLCGGATDLALTSINLQQPEQRLGVTIATCCHHCCDAKTYVNLPFLRQYFTDDEITVLPRFSSWAVSPQVGHVKQRIGFKVKRLLDYGRCRFIEETMGMEVVVHQYCDPYKESPESTLIVAKVK